MATGRDHRLAALVVDEVIQAIGIVSAVSQNLAGRYASDQVAGGRHIVLLAWPQNEADRQPKVKRLLSSDHFSVDGTLIEAWASIKSFRRKDGSDDDPQGPGRNAERDFHKEKRSNETHASTTDPEARLYKKGDGQPARLCYIGHVLMENRNGLAVDGASPRQTAPPSARRRWRCWTGAKAPPHHAGRRQGL
jgi:hypothetical protein